MQNDIFDAENPLITAENTTSTINFDDLLSNLNEKLEATSLVNDEVIFFENPVIKEMPSFENSICHLDEAIESNIANINSELTQTIATQEIAIQESPIIITKIEVLDETPVAPIINIEKVTHVIPVVSFIDINNQTNQQNSSKLEEEIKNINSQRRHKKISAFIVDKTKFLTHYVVVSTLVFVILLWWVNYSAYSKIAYDFMNPDNLKNSSKEILSVIDNSKIKVFADEDISSLWQEQQNEIQEKLKVDNVQLRDTYFSPKKLVPLKSNVDLSVEIVPYENRLIIPKIWKNIPLVDVDTRRWIVNFDNLENIFMTELEKWVVRYPGTAKPWENWVAFVFWHSSNYPWMKWEYNDVFALLDNLNIWDEIIIYYNQKKFTYVISEKKVIKPGNIKIIDRDPNKKELSLMTCWPIGTSLNRLITFAELKEEK